MAKESVGKSEYERFDVDIANIDGEVCSIEIPLNIEATTWSNHPTVVGREYLVVTADDPYCAGRIDARALYEWLKKRYGE